MKLKFKRLSDLAVAPFQATRGSAGFDLTCTFLEVDHVTKTVKYNTDIAVEIPEGYVGLLFPRSSVYRTGMTLSNCVGVLDSDYRGPISFIYKFRELNTIYGQFERVGQLVIVPNPKFQLEEVDELTDTERGEGGFGSTGK